MRDHVKKNATLEQFDKIMASATNGGASHEEHKNGSTLHNKNGKDHEGDGEGSELSETSDLQDLDGEDDDNDVAMGSDEEEKQ